jgi:hypothetical protein
VRLYRDNWPEFRKLFDQAPSAADKVENDLFSRTIWGQSYKLAQRQLEEVFCDYVGLYVFGRSFLHSFRYLIAPSLGYPRNLQYPRLRDRADYMVQFGKKLGIPEILGYADSFREQEDPLAPGVRFILTMADGTTRNLYSQLSMMVDKYHGQAEAFNVGAKDEPGVKKLLMNLVPAASTKSMTAVVNAAWDIRLALNDWDILNDIGDEVERRKEKLRVLKDLVLKSFEVYEVQKRNEK